MRLIDADELINFFYSEISGTDEHIQSLIDKHHLTYENDVNEDDAIDLCYDFLEGVKNAINTQPTVNEWIPVERELPEEGEDVFAVIGNDEEYIIDKAVYICEGVWLKDLIKFDPNDDVIAWKPIPEYTGDKK